MICSACGAWIDDVSQPFCDACGASLDDSADGGNAGPPATAPPWVAAI